MQRLSYLAAALIAATVLVAGPVRAANMCQTEHMTCATTMPVDGYCVCRAQGSAEDGTVVPPGAPHGKVNSTAGGCGTNPSAPGCR